MSCISSSSYSVLVNGCLAGFFKGTWDLRQSDPLSPFLFIMVSEALSRMIRRAEMGYITGFSVGMGSDDFPSSICG